MLCLVAALLAVVSGRASAADCAARGLEDHLSLVQEEPVSMLQVKHSGRHRLVANQAVDEVPAGHLDGFGANAEATAGLEVEASSFDYDTPDGSYILDGNGQNYLQDFEARVAADAASQPAMVRADDALAVAPADVLGDVAPSVVLADNALAGFGREDLVRQNMSGLAGFGTQLEPLDTPDGNYIVDSQDTLGWHDFRPTEAPWPFDTPRTETAGASPPAEADERRGPLSWFRRPDAPLEGDDAMWVDYLHDGDNELDDRDPDEDYPGHGRTSPTWGEVLGHR